MATYPITRGAARTISAGVVRLARPRNSGSPITAVRDIIDERHTGRRRISTTTPLSPLIHRHRHQRHHNAQQQQQQPTQQHQGGYDDQIFSKATALIFVLDAQDEPYNHVLQSFTDTVTRAVCAPTPPSPWRSSCTRWTGSCF
mmetsp:Transcript_22798/g.49288  ORF Transcript_22798/g.49288 Transcript_22798/m.49288 type:complete len:143 (+) Transcript_22798:132-560(+)